jgi:glutathione S-transferase
MLKVWGRANSHNVKKVVWVLREMRHPHSCRDMGGKFGYTEEYAAKNPNKLVPTIEDEGLVLWESNAILRYLAARYAPNLWPNDPAIRAEGDKWMDWQLAYADAQRDAFIQLVRLPPEQRDNDVITASAERCDALMCILDAALARTSWLSGDTFGVGDIPMGVYVHTFYELGRSTTSLPNVAPYAETILVPLT